MTDVDSNPKMDGVTRTPTQRRIIEFLQAHFTGVLATVTRERKPHATAIYYMADDYGTVRFMTKRQTEKSKNIQFNNCVMLVIYDEREQTVVQIEGIATEIEDDKEAHQVFRNTLKASLHTAESAIPPITKLDAGTYLAYRIEPSEMRIAVYDHHSAGDHERIIRSAELPVLNLSS